MSSMVWERYPNGGGELTLALALADHAHDDGRHIFPTVDHLARKTRQSPRTVQYQLKCMRETGWLIPTNAGHGGRGMASEYRISPEWIKGADFASLKKGADSDEKGATDGEKGAAAIAPAVNHQEPSVNRQRRGARLPDDWVLPKSWGEWALKEYPAWTDEHVRRIALMFRNHWVAKSGKDAAKLDWFATWQNWCLKEPAVPKGTQVPTDASASAAQTSAWWRSMDGVQAKGAELGLAQKTGQGELYRQFRVRVLKTAGPGVWREDYLKEISREEAEHERVLAYFSQGEVQA